MLTVFIDFNSPASYLAIEPTLQLVKRLGIELRWKPFRTTLQPIPKEVPNESQGQSHRRVRALARQQTHIHYAKLQGIELKFPFAPSRTDLALGVLAQCSKNPENFIRKAFYVYWHNHFDLNDADTVREIIEQCENIGDINIPQALHSLESAQKFAENACIIDAPAYMIGEQLFIGREHLPWIEEILLST